MLISYTMRWRACVEEAAWLKVATKMTGKRHDLLNHPHAALSSLLAGDRVAGRSNLTGTPTAAQDSTENGQLSALRGKPGVAGSPGRRPPARGQWDQQAAPVGDAWWGRSVDSAGCPAGFGGGASLGAPGPCCRGSARGIMRATGHPQRIAAAAVQDAGMHPVFPRKFCHAATPTLMQPPMEPIPRGVLSACPWNADSGL